MDKKLLLYFLLAIVFLILFGFYFYSIKENQPPQSTSSPLDNLTAEEQLIRIKPASKIVVSEVTRKNSIEPSNLPVEIQDITGLIVNNNNIFSNILASQVDYANNSRGFEVDFDSPYSNLEAYDLFTTSFDTSTWTLVHAIFSSKAATIDLESKKYKASFEFLELADSKTTIKMMVLEK